MRRAALLAVCVAGCASPQPGDPLSGGATTTNDSTSLAYAQAAPNLTSAELDSFNLGHAIFNQNWVQAPATTSDMDGLGPIFNQRSCSACHSHDGRSAPLTDAGQFLGLLVRVSVDGVDPHGGPLGDATYETQIRPFGILKVPGDATPQLTYVEQPGTYDDGTPYSLEVPSLAMALWNYGTPATALHTSVRMGNAVFGLGLLEAVPEAEILANIRSNDPDGVVGKANYVWNLVDHAATLGRFGWKANQPSVAQQTAGALQGDMGITSTLVPDEPCSAAMTECNAAPRGGQPDIADDHFDALVLYMQTLAVPARRDVKDARALSGEHLFTEMGCASCHTPTLHTGTVALDAVSNQTIHPYTDLLLHDLGPGLADGRDDYMASGTEWRTTPLWGIGLLEKVNGHQQLLHDGRARGLEEAILWHDGEAAAAKHRFSSASANDRADLISFLNSL
ncbi:MAG: di-heme oxidoredictase family protein [Polyangia bacterium]